MNILHKCKKQTETNEKNLNVTNKMKIIDN